jgi:uncharacterized protein (TIGR03086 family)
MAGLADTVQNWSPASDSFPESAGSSLVTVITEERNEAMQVTELDRALGSTMAILVKVEPGQLDAPTPCASWDVRALINHFTGTARWWAGMIDGEDGGDGTFADYAAGDYVAAYAEAMKIALSTFGSDDVPGRTVRLPFGEFTGDVVTAMAALDQFTHGWDLARAIGCPADLDSELAADLLSHARLAVGEGLRGGDGAAPFGPAVDAPAGAGPADQLAAFLGRPV